MSQRRVSRLTAGWSSVDTDTATRCTVDLDQRGPVELCAGRHFTKSGRFKHGQNYRIGRYLTGVEDVWYGVSYGMEGGGHDVTCDGVTTER